MSGLANSYILEVNLSTRESQKWKIPDNWFREYIGGRGINIRYLYERLKPKTDPLSEENILMIGTGPLSGTPFGAGRMSISTKSPQTGLLLDGNAGGDFAAELAFAGYANIAVTGKADQPVYLYVNDDVVEIREAKHLWGKTTWETHDILDEELGPGFKMIYIGPAGEKLINMSLVISKRNHAGGRGGGGAVMGSKNLKAIVVKGSKDVKVQEPDRFLNALDAFRHEFSFTDCQDPWVKVWHVHGTLVIGAFAQAYGANLAYNCREEVYDEMEKFSEYTLLKDYITEPRSCFCCPFASGGHVIRLADGFEMEGLQAGIITAFGPLCGISDVDAVVRAAARCNQLGLASISTGMTIAWAMECFEKGILTLQDTDGLDLRFGNSEAMLALLDQIAYREGFGALLSYGVKIAADKVGKGADYYAMHMKGLEHSTPSARAFKAMALGHAVNDIGSDHTRLYPPYPPMAHLLSEETRAKLPFDLAKASDRTLPEGKGSMVKWLFDTRAILNVLEVCLLHSRGRHFAEPVPFADGLSALTGEEFTLSDLEEVGERVVNLERLFCVREGLRPEQETIPRRYMEEPQTRGGSQGLVTSAEQLEVMINEYYEARGWDRITCMPKTETIARLNLGWAIDGSGGGKSDEN